MTTITELKKRLKDLQQSGAYPPSAKPLAEMSMADLQRLANKYDSLLLEMKRREALEAARAQAFAEECKARFFTPSVTTASITFPVLGTYGAVERSEKVPNWAHVPDTESIYDEPLCSCGRRHAIWDRCRPLAIR